MMMMLDHTLSSQGVEHGLTWLLIRTFRDLVKEQQQKKNSLGLHPSSTESESPGMRSRSLYY